MKFHYRFHYRQDGNEWIVLYGNQIIWCRCTNEIHAEVICKALNLYNP